MSICAAAVLMSACAHQPRTLVAYFSITGPTYTPDGIVSLEKGNTQTFAETICEFTGADLFRIERENPYPDDYEAICSISRQETESGARPALKASCPGATIIEGLALAGHEVKDAQDQIRAFCRNGKYRQVL